jgi:hypothetical protein
MCFHTFKARVIADEKMVLSSRIFSTELAVRNNKGNTKVFSDN